MSTANRVVVIGGGIMGISIAYYLTRLGARSVTVCEAGAVAQGSTGLSSGGIRSQFGTREETLLSLRSLDLWSQVERDLAVDLGLRRVGYCLLLTEGSRALVATRRAFQRELGLHVEEWTGADLEWRMPGMVTRDLAGALFTPHDGYAAPADVTMTLAAAARDRGAVIHQGMRVTAIVVTQGRIAAVQTTQGDLACDTVVNAAGIDAPAIGEMVGLRIPVIPYRQHQFVTEPVAWLPATVPCVQDGALDLYLRPEGSGLLFGVASAEEAGSRSRTVTWALAGELAAKLEHRWPRLTDAQIAHAWVGCYELSPDHQPFLGQCIDPAGFVYANGFSGHGFMHGLAAGEAIAELIVYGQPRTSDLRPFCLERLARAV